MPRECGRAAAGDDAPSAVPRRPNGVQFAADVNGQGGSGEEDGTETSSESEASQTEDESETPAPKPSNAIEAMQYLYEAAGTLERDKGFGYSTGVQQMLTIANRMLEEGGEQRVDEVVALADAWLDNETIEMKAGGVVCGNAAQAVKRLAADAAAAPPDVVWVASPNHWQHCEGAYKLDPSRTTNNQPIWVLYSREDHYDPGTAARGDSRALRYLYSTPLGKWRVTNDPADFSGGGGYIMSAVEHNGAPPHLAEAWCIKGAEDPDVHVTAQLGEAVAFADDELDAIALYPIVSPGAGRIQYAVNGIPRPPTSSVTFSYEPTPTLAFPDLDCEIVLDAATVHKTLVALREALQGCGVHAVLPSSAWRAWLSCWQVLASQVGDTPPYYYHTVTRRTTWDLAAQLKSCMAETQGGQNTA